MEYRRGNDAPHSRLDVGRPDHLALLLGFSGDEPAEVGGRNSLSAFTQLDQFWKIHTTSIFSNGRLKPYVSTK